MKIITTEPSDRRGFMRAALRMLATGMLGAVGCLLYGRSRKVKLSGQTCDNNGICCNCGAFRGCRLPQALSARRINRAGDAS